LTAGGWFVFDTFPWSLPIAKSARAIGAAADAASAGSSVPRTLGVRSANGIGEAAVHGNSLLSPRTAYLYRLTDAEGNFLKWGVTQNMATRYSKAFMEDKLMFKFAEGTRADMIRLERGLVETQGGPLNLEPWSPTRRLGGQP
jgi:hypothetical protein